MGEREKDATGLLKINKITDVFQPDKFSKRKKKKKKKSFVPMRLAGWQAQGVLQVQAFDDAKFSAKITFTR